MASALVAGLLLAQARDATALRPGTRVVVDAHNCYPYNGRWGDRIERALSTGLPVAIEQDLYWYKGRSVLSHGKDVDGTEPGMREYFFERIRPIMEQALREQKRREWPLITLNLDFKTDEAEHHAAVWKLLGEYQSWLTTAERSADPARVTPLRPGPLLVLTGEEDSQERDFHDIMAAGSQLRAFGAIHAPGWATNYRRWWNNSWKVVEEAGQPATGDWSKADATRLGALVRQAHKSGLWIRFYTLNGHSADQESKQGWGHDYNFGSRERAEQRWRAAIHEGVDYLATDQYEDLARFMH